MFTPCPVPPSVNNVSSIMTTCYFSYVFRNRLRRRLKTADDEDDKEDIEEITIGKVKGADKFTVVGG